MGKKQPGRYKNPRLNGRLHTESQRLISLHSTTGRVCTAVGFGSVRIELLSLLGRSIGSMSSVTMVSEVKLQKWEDTGEYSSR